MNSMTDQFVDYLFELAHSSLSEEVLHESQRCMLDYLGVTLAGRKLLGKKVESLLEGAEKGTYQAIGFDEKLSLTDAVLINSVCSHVAEMDDGSRFGMMHPGAPVFSALWPVALQEKSDKLTFLQAVVVGYEVALWLACELQPKIKQGGYHATGVCGSVGVAVAIATLRRYNKAQFKASVSAAVLTAGGLLGAIDDESELKPYNIAHTANSGIMAAKIARAGFTGPIDAIGGKRGFATVIATKPDLTFDKQGQVEILNTYIKPYAACRHCHSAIAAVLTLKDRAAFNVAQIKEVLVHTYDLAVEGHDHTNIDGVSSAKMSIPYSVAVALVSGAAGLNEFLPEVLTNSSVMALAKRVTVAADKRYSALVPQKRVAEVTLVFCDGKRLVECVDLPKGEPESRMTDEELLDKFSNMVAFAGTIDTSSALIGKKILDEKDEVTEWLGLLTNLLK